MSAAPRRRVVAVAPVRRPTAAGLRPGDAVRARQRSGAARRHRVAAVVRRGRRRPGDRPQRHRARARRRQAGRRAARRRGVERRVRPGPHVRQPLRVLLHLPAAQGPAPQPVPEGRRLPAELPVRELHDADPLHRGRPRAGRHRGPVAAARQHPRHRPGRCGRRCCATRAARRACAGCGRCSTTASRCAASSSSARASTTARRSTTRSPASSTSTRSWRRVAVVPLGISRFNPEAGDAPAHRGRGGRRRRRRRGLAGRLRGGARPPPRARRRRVLPDGRPAVPRRRALRGLHDARGRHRHGPHVRARVHRRRRRRHRAAARLLRRRRRRRRRAATRCRRTRPPTPACASAPPTPRRSRCGRAARRPVGDPVRRARRPRRSRRSSPGSVATTCGSSRSPTSSSAATPASPA